jgi:hypothetical protein
MAILFCLGIQIQIHYCWIPDYKIVVNVKHESKVKINQDIKRLDYFEKHDDDR